MEVMNLILGTMNFGPQVSTVDSIAMIEFFIKKGFSELDTAYVYNAGETEEILGNALGCFNLDQYSIATKANPRVTGRLDAVSVKQQLYESLIRLKQQSVEMLYLHFPDFNTPIEETLEACNSLYMQGKIRQLGLSNFPSWLVMEAWYICDKKGWIKPTVYEGLYNGLSRKVEPELFPAIRKLGIKFYAYNPLAGGLLTGKHLDYNIIPSEGRFSRLASYKKRYWKKSFFKAVNALHETCYTENISLVDAAYRWLAFHSMLDSDKGDGIIVGASTISQLVQNLDSLTKGALPQKIVDLFDVAWEESRLDSPEYFRTADV